MKMMEEGETGRREKNIMKRMAVKRKNLKKRYADSIMVHRTYLAYFA